MLEALAKAGWCSESAALDSTCVKAQRAAYSGKRGAREQAIGSSRAGSTTKIHLLSM